MSVKGMGVWVGFPLRLLVGVLELSVVGLVEVSSS